VAGGRVDSSFTSLGTNTDSTGTAIISGTGSLLSNKSILYVGKDGSGTLTVTDGGMVTVNTGLNSGGGLYASLISLFGNGTIATNGAVLDADLVFDAAHGLQNQFAFGTGGILNLNQNGNYVLGAGYKGNGTLRIADGIAVQSSVGYLGYYSGSTGTATVTGTGSKWTDSGNLYIGYYGNGALTVTDGGFVSINNALFASMSSLAGNGTITTNGAVLDADLVFDANHGLQQTFVFGTGGTLNLSQNASSALGAGYTGNGTVRIAGGITVQSSVGYLGYNTGATGTSLVNGTGSKWTVGSDLSVGFFGSGNLDIEAGGQVSSTNNGFLGRNVGSNGMATVSGAGSIWSTNYFTVGYAGSGTLIIEAGGKVSNTTGYLGNNSSSTGIATITGTGSKWINSGSINIGYGGNGTLNIQSGGQISNIDGYLGYNSGSIGTATVTGANSIWTNSGILYIGKDGNGILNIQAGAKISNTTGYLGYASGATGTATVTGTDSIWTNSGILYVGNFGNGTLNIEAGGQVSNTDGVMGYFAPSNSTVTVNGTGSKWTNSGVLSIGYDSNGTLNIEAGGIVICSTASIGDGVHSIGSVKVTGTGSMVNSNGLAIGNSGNGSLRIEASGQVSNTSSSFVGYSSRSTGIVTVTGTGSMWSSNSSFYIGSTGSGTLNIEAGGQVRDTNNDINFMSYVGYNSGSTGTVTVSGLGSKWSNSALLYLGYAGSGTLNVGSASSIGGLVMAKWLELALNSNSIGTCNINGGMVQVGYLSRGGGSANFNWNDGTIQNYDSNTNLSIPKGLVLKLAETGIHAFNIDLNRTGTIDAVLSDMTTNGSLKKTGAGALVLTGVDTYSGGTVVEGGRFKVTGSILGTSGINVGTAGILELAKTAGSATAANLAIDNDGMVLISAGSQTVGAISGTGITQVNAGASLTAHSIVQDRLTIGGTGAGTTGLADASTMSQVPEPSTLALLWAGVVGAFILVWRRKLRLPPSAINPLPALARCQIDSVPPHARGRSQRIIGLIVDR
jgi:fibronectin-binding autotransporter adhesin